MVSEENNKRITEAKKHIKEILEGLKHIKNLDGYGKNHMIPNALKFLNRTLNSMLDARNQNAYNKNVVLMYTTVLPHIRNIRRQYGLSKNFATKNSGNENNTPSKLERILGVTSKPKRTASSKSVNNNNSNSNNWASRPYKPNKGKPNLLDRFLENSLTVTTKNR